MNPNAGRAARPSSGAARAATGYGETANTGSPAEHSAATTQDAATPGRRRACEPHLRIAHILSVDSRVLLDVSAPVAARRGADEAVPLRECRRCDGPRNTTRVWRPAEHRRHCTAGCSAAVLLIMLRAGRRVVHVVSGGRLRGVGRRTGIAVALAFLVLVLATACGGSATPAAPRQLPATPAPHPLPETATAPLDATTCPTAYPIKGYRNKRGVPLYRTPRTRDYEKVTPEACFATEPAARAAGYRRAEGP